MVSYSSDLVSGPIVNTAVIPGSKSITNRALVLSLLATAPTSSTSPISTIRNPLYSRDTKLMLKAIQSLGATVTTEDSRLTIAAPLQKITAARINCGLSGTVLRFLTPIAALLADKESYFFGDEQAKQRPIFPLIKALEILGAKVDNCQLPFHIAPAKKVIHRKVAVDATLSSQFISGLLMVAPLLPNGLLIENTSISIPSLPHIDLTIQMLKKTGINVINGPNSWQIPPGDISPTDWEIEPDLTNAAVFCAAALITKGKVTIPFWPKNTSQPGKYIIDIIRQMGGTTNYLPVNDSYGSLVVSTSNDLRGILIDMKDYGELVPTVAALATQATSPSIITGISHLKGHETNRIQALYEQINKAGGNCEIIADGIKITPTSQMHKTVWDTYNDHRIATTGVLISLKVPGIVVRDIETTDKTFPNFLPNWKQFIAS